MKTSEIVVHQTMGRIIIGVKIPEYPGYHSVMVFFSRSSFETFVELCLEFLGKTAPKEEFKVSEKIKKEIQEILNGNP